MEKSVGIVNRDSRPTDLQPVVRYPVERERESTIGRDDGPPVVRETRRRRTTRHKVTTPACLNTRSKSVGFYRQRYSETVNPRPHSLNPGGILPDPILKSETERYILLRP